MKRQYVKYHVFLERYFSKNSIKKSNLNLIIMNKYILNEITTQSIDYCLTNGAMMGINIPDYPHRSVFTHMPFSLFPVKVPKDIFQFAIDIAPIYSQLYINVSKDHKFLFDSLDGMSDDFTKSLLAIAHKIDENYIEQPIFDIFRSDYMIHSPNNNEKKELLQVEFNTISCSFGCLGDKAYQMHDFICNKYKDEIDYPNKLPVTDNINKLVDAFYTAFSLYNKSTSYILFVVQGNENNLADQRIIEELLFKKYNIHCLRRTLKEIKENGILLDDKTLVVNDKIISIVYFRAGYTPKDYPTYIEWDARMLIEQSNAIKCPNIFLQLSGAKKIQQILANEGITEKYLSKENSELIRKTYAGLYSLNKDIIDKVLKDPESYVIKPQREGGGNNIYGKDIPQFIKELKEDEYSSYIVMSRILPTINEGHLVRNSERIYKQVVSEIGIFSTYIENHGKVINNTYTGHIVRTKALGVDEGGVATGYSTLDSPYLI